MTDTAREYTAITLWPIDTELVRALDERLGTPVDCYVNGSQTWLTPDGPGEIMLEWRLHPVGGYVTPAGMSHYEVFETVVAALSVGADAGQLHLGDEVRALGELWTGLECYAAYGDPIDPEPLATHAAEALGITPSHSGRVDHQSVADAWERSQRQTSLYDLATEALDQIP